MADTVGVVADPCSILRLALERWQALGLFLLLLPSRSVRSDFFLPGRDPFMIGPPVIVNRRLLRDIFILEMISNPWSSMYGGFSFKTCWRDSVKSEVVYREALVLGIDPHLKADYFKTLTKKLTRRPSTRTRRLHGGCLHYPPLGL